MIALGVNGIAGGTQLITVPPTAVSIVGFNSAPRVALDFNSWVSANVQATVADLSAGNSSGLLAIGNTSFPPIPVSAGERLLVAFTDVASAVIYFGE